MEERRIPLEQGLKELCGVFGLEPAKEDYKAWGEYVRGTREKNIEEGFSYMYKDKESGDYVFMIDKKHVHRDKLIAMLQDYYSKTIIADHFCSIDPITLVWTQFKIVNMDKYEEDAE